AGFHDPLHGSGVAAALLSGGVAALGVVDREEARRRFAAFTRMFSIRRRLAREAWGTPASASRLWLAEALAAVVPPVGGLGRYGTGP
ncbi:MAG TPA: hypothetical protein VMS88_02065, partial [Terriglobales bacterium]|nr:hypothetical protein [Terriglobales bacterium]